MIRYLRLFFMLFAFSSSAFAIEQQTVEIEVSGMTCPFCVYGTEKKLSKLQGVDNVEVSLDKKKARIVMKEGQAADISAIKNAITDAGFTAGEARINGALVNEKIIQ